MKKVIKTAALSVSVIALASTAFAADLNMNIYGASAQGKFWNTYAKSFVEASVDDGGMGCTGTTIVGYADAGKKMGITVGQTCAAAAGGKVFIRYTSNKSVEGPRAVMNLDPQENDKCLEGNPTNDPTRKQADWNATDGFTQKCLDVHIGASDVSSEAFTQESHGNINGTYTTTDYNEVLLGQVIPGAEIGTSRQPMIVPFAFFANDTLEVDHINRQQALLLMSGNIGNWSQFGDDDYPSKKVVLCMRHAGSGTHATLDKAIMRGDRKLVSSQRLAPTAFLPAVLFHESSTNMLDCVDDNGTQPTASAGAIGYADADGIVASYNADGTENKKTDYANVKRLRYNGGGEGMISSTYLGKYGHSPLKEGIIKGTYEFWASQWMYINADEQNAPVELYEKMMDFAEATELPCPGLGCYWLTASQIDVTKEDDSTVPHF